MRGQHDQHKKKKHLTYFASILWYSSVHERILQHFLHM